MRRRFVVTSGLVLAGAMATVALNAQDTSFDRLSSADRTALQQRFEKEVWPLMNQGGKKSCVGCHSGKIVTALRLTGDANKDFAMLVREGFFLPDDAGSLLSRITDKDPERRMPRGGEAWKVKDVAVLADFVADLDKKQKK